ncbi:hypothetical protein [Desulforamulus ruminis]|uniref:Rubrerythrin diiron-binding domain-containing protein n=1 Tax=Desulforamulus ruminis (strain ATCC 23193 / DSM 2154 / NCIMB 8452 / DL) TaxID=696281 RepID=F6DSG0_DESRL|nr:hypothetical protein [Desulforamulus ruminis]AEG61050.1 hypothetical protein Desru_2836 [Desulforamulus ruminis DSM 2154]
MPKLTQKDILNNILKRAFDQEVQQKAKYAFLAGTVKDKRLIKIFKVFEHTAQSHIAELQQEMYNLDIK